MKYDQRTAKELADLKAMREARSKPPILTLEEIKAVRRKK